MKVRTTDVVNKQARKTGCDQRVGTPFLSFLISELCAEYLGGSVWTVFTEALLGIYRIAFCCFGNLRSLILGLK